MDELDFIQPKKVVGEMISMSVIEDIKTDLKNKLFKDSQVITNRDALSMSCFNHGILVALEIINEHIEEEYREIVGEDYDN